MPEILGWCRCRFRGDARLGEFAAEVGPIAARQFHQTEVKPCGGGVVMQKGELIGEFGDVRVGKRFLDHGRGGLGRVEDGPGAVVVGIAVAEGDGAVEAGAGDAGAELREAVTGEGQVGELGVPGQRVALQRRVVECLGGVFPAAPEDYELSA